MCKFKRKKTGKKQLFYVSKLMLIKSNTFTMHLIVLIENEIN